MSYTVYNYLSGKVTHIETKNRFSYGKSMRTKRITPGIKEARGIGSALREEYSNVRDTFDKVLRRTGRLYEKH